MTICRSKNQIEIIAHRGYLLIFPENTLIAFQKALGLGASGVELDIQMSRDRVPVVIHDETVDKTTNGHGFVNCMTQNELKQLDAGAKFSLLTWRENPIFKRSTPFNKRKRKNVY